MCSEPLAVALWVAIIVFLLTWAIMGSIYWDRGAKAKEETWQGGLRWANRVLDPAWAATHPDWKKDRLAAHQVRARAILRGESCWVLSD